MDVGNRVRSESGEGSSGKVRAVLMPQREAVFLTSHICKNTSRRIAYNFGGQFILPSFFFLAA